MTQRGSEYRTFWRLAFKLYGIGMVKNFAIEMEALWHSLCNWNGSLVEITLQLKWQLGGTYFAIEMAALWHTLCNWNGSLVVLTLQLKWQLGGTYFEIEMAAVWKLLGIEMAAWWHLLCNWNGSLVIFVFVENLNRVNHLANHQKVSGTWTER